MKISIILCALFSLLPHLLILNVQHPDFFNHTCFNDKGTYKDKSAYHTNLNIVLSNFTSDTENYFGFYDSSYGESPNRVNGLGMCRGDAQLHACQSCIKNATILLPKLCPNQKEAFLYYDLCILRYSNVSILGMYQNPEFSYTIHSPEKAKDARKYRDALDGLMMRLKSKASSGDSLTKAAVGNQTADENESVFGLAQCTPDLTQQDCDDCLVTAISEIQGCCKDKIGGRVIKLSCNLRFDKVMFYDPAVIEPIQSPSALAIAPSPVADPPKGVAESPSKDENVEVKGTKHLLDYEYIILINKRPDYKCGNLSLCFTFAGDSNKTSRILVMMAVAIGAFTTLKGTTATGL